MHDVHEKLRVTAINSGHVYELDMVMTYDVEEPFDVEVIFLDLATDDAARWVLSLDMFMHATYLRSQAVAYTGDAYMIPMVDDLRVGLRERLPHIPRQRWDADSMVLHLESDVDCDHCGELHEDSMSVIIGFEDLRAFCDKVNDATKAFIKANA